VHGTAKSQEHNFEQVKDDKIQAQNLAISHLCRLRLCLRATSHIHRHV
jgi:hypothetical protein